MFFQCRYVSLNCDTCLCALKTIIADQTLKNAWTIDSHQYTICAAVIAQSNLTAIAGGQECVNHCLHACLEIISIQGSGTSLQTCRSISAERSVLLLFSLSVHGLDWLL